MERAKSLSLEFGGERRASSIWRRPSVLSDADDARLTSCAWDFDSTNFPTARYNLWINLAIATRRALGCAAHRRKGREYGAGHTGEDGARLRRSRPMTTTGSPCTTMSGHPVLVPQAFKRSLPLPCVPRVAQRGGEHAFPRTMLTTGRTASNIVFDWLLNSRSEAARLYAVTVCMHSVWTDCTAVNRTCLSMLCTFALFWGLWYVRRDQGP